MHCEWCCVPRHVGIITHSDIGRQGVLTSCYSFKMECLLISDFIMALLRFKASKKMDCQRWTYYLATLFSSHYTTDFFTQVYINGAVHVPPVPTTCQNLGGHELWLCLGTPAILTYVCGLHLQQIYSMYQHNFLKTKVPPQNSRCQTDNMQQVPHWSCYDGLVP